MNVTYGLVSGLLGNPELKKTFFFQFYKTFYLKRKVYRQANANVDFDKNMLLLKNPQFSMNHYETLTQ